MNTDKRNRHEFHELPKQTSLTRRAIGFRLTRAQQSVKIRAIRVSYACLSVFIGG